MAPHCTCGCYSHQCHMVRGKKNEQFYLMFLMKQAIETLYFIKSDMHSFWSLSEGMELLRRDLNVASWRMKAAPRKHAYVILWVRNCSCFCGRLFLFERMTNEQWLFRLGYLADILWKMNKMNMSLQVDQLIFVAHDNTRILETISVTVGLRTF